MAVKNKAERQIAKEFMEAFETKTRRDTIEEYTTLKEGSPQWMRDAVREAHGEMFPDDYVFRMAASVTESIEGYLSTDNDIEDSRSEIVDNLVDVYTSDLTAWLASHIYRVSYCDEAAEEYGTDDLDMTQRMMRGQYFEIDQIFGAIFSAIQTQAEGNNDANV